MSPIGLSHTIEHGMITYRGLPAPLICDYLSRKPSQKLYAEGTEFHIGRIDMVANTGTYLDSPFHRYADGKDLIPDLFDVENFSAIGPERLRELQTALQKTRGVDLLSMPIVLTRPGQQARISIGKSTEAMLSFGLRADSVAEDGGYDLSLDLQRQA